MSRKIKKLTKLAIFSLFWLGALVVTVFVRLLGGGHHSNLLKMSDRVKNAVGNSKVVPEAKADVIIPSCSGPACTGTSCGCTCPGCSS